MLLCSAKQTYLSHFLLWTWLFTIKSLTVDGTRLQYWCLWVMGLSVCLGCFPVILQVWAPTVPRASGAQSFGMLLGVHLCYLGFPSPKAKSPWCTSTTGKTQVGGPRSSGVWCCMHQGLPYRGDSWGMKMGSLKPHECLPWAAGEHEQLQAAHTLPP